MAKRAPSGARQSAKDVLNLRKHYGAKTAAKMLGVSPSTVYRVSNTAKKRTAVGKVISTRQSADKWSSRVDTAHGAMAKDLLGSLRATRPKSIAKGLSEAGIETSYQQVTWWQRKAGITKWTRRKDVIKPLSGFESRILSTELEEAGRELVGNVWVYKSPAFLPPGGEVRKSFPEVDDALYWMKEVGAGAVYFVIVKREDGFHDIIFYDEAAEYRITEEEEREAWDEIDKWS